MKSSSRHRRTCVLSRATSGDRSTVVHRLTSILGQGIAEKRAQMFVEAAVVFPVALVIALIGVNVFWFLEAVTAFDRISFDAVIVRACSPGSNQTIAQSDKDIEALIVQSLSQHKRIELEVHSRSLAQDERGKYHFSLAPHLREYTCTLRYKPWPTRISIAGVHADPPAFLQRTKSIVVDPYRSGVVF